MQEDRAELLKSTTDVLNMMFLLCKHLSLYSEDNAVVAKTTDRLLLLLSHSHTVQGDLLVTVGKHGFLAQGQFLSKNNELYQKFARRMFQHGISSFTLDNTLTVPSLYSFLRVILRKPAETWDEGGIGACLQNRDITGIAVTEMSESDFLLLDSADHEQIDDRQASSDLWLRFARSIFNTLTGEEIVNLALDATPAELADRISELLTDRPAEEREALSLEITRFAATLQREKIKTARTAALLNLADFINNLSDRMRKQVIGGICNLQMTEDYAADFFNGLSDHSIIDAFKESTAQQGYVPPIVMTLISKLASTRKLIPQEELAAQQAIQEERKRKIKELFRPDEFNKYVPTRYQNALMQVLNNQQLPEGLDKKLVELKQSLEDFQVERQMVRLSLFLIKNDPDEHYLRGLRAKLIASMQFHLDASDYDNLTQLCLTCFAGKTEEELKQLCELIPDSFTNQILADVPRLGKDIQPQVSEIITLIGVPFIRPLIEFIATEDDRSVRLFYLNNLKKLGAQVAEHAVLFLKDDRWFVQRNMLILLGELGAVHKLSKIKPLLNHSHQKVRQEALKTCLLLQDNDSLQQLINNLSSENRQEVLHAITMSQLINHPNLSAALLEMLKESDLFHFDFDVKKALVQTLAEHKNPQALAVFSEMLKSRRLFKSALYNKLKVEIVKALGKYPAAQVTSLLKQQINEGTEEAAGQARQVLKRISQEDA